MGNEKIIRCFIKKNSFSVIVTPYISIILLLNIIHLCDINSGPSKCGLCRHMEVWVHMNTLKYNTANLVAIASVTDYLIS